MLKIVLFVLIAMASPFALQAGDAIAAGNPRPFVVYNAELRSLHSSVTDRDYLLYIGYPPSYGSDPARKYPVVYLTDGYWGFDRVFAQCSTGIWWDEIVPEFILVGIGYDGEGVDYGSERIYELSPVSQTWGLMKGFKGRQGGSRLFLDAIKTEIIPFVETNLKADPSFRVLMGASMGGLFSLYSMYEEPELFQGIVAASPTVPWKHCWLFNREDELRSKVAGPDNTGRLRIPVRCFMSVGSAETPSFIGYIRAFNEVISSGEYQDFHYQFRMVDGERHAGSVAEAFNRGLRFVFEPQMPWRGYE